MRTQRAKTWWTYRARLCAWKPGQEGNIFALLTPLDSESVLWLRKVGSGYTMNFEDRGILFRAHARARMQVLVLPTSSLPSALLKSAFGAGDVGGESVMWERVHRSG